MGITLVTIKLRIKISATDDIICGAYKLCVTI